MSDDNYVHESLARTVQALVRAGLDDPNAVEGLVWSLEKFAPASLRDRCREVDALIESAQTAALPEDKQDRLSDLLVELLVETAR